MTNHYLNRYNKLIDYYTFNPILYFRDGSSELHHIIPRSYGGTDELTNLVRLPVRAHYIAHLLLHLANPKCFKMKSAFVRMSSKLKKNTSKYYEALRKYKAIMSQETKDKVSTSIKAHFLTDEYKAKASAAQLKRYENPKELEANRLRQKQRYIDNPHLRKKHSEKIKAGMPDTLSLEYRFKQCKKYLYIYENIETKEQFIGTMNHSVSNTGHRIDFVNMTEHGRSHRYGWKIIGCLIEKCSFEQYVALFDTLSSEHLQLKAEIIDVNIVK